MIYIFPAALLAFGIWRFRALSRMGVLEAWLGAGILAVCIILAGVYLTGAITCAVFC